MVDILQEGFPSLPSPDEHRYGLNNPEEVRKYLRDLIRALNQQFNFQKTDADALAGGAFTNPMTTRGDIIYENSSGDADRLAIGGANTVLHGGTDPSYSAVVEADLSLSDNTTNNVSTSKHGFTPKLSNDSTQFLDGTGAWSSPSSSGGLLQVDIFTGNGTWTKPAGCNAVEVWVVGGGGGAGGASTAGNEHMSGAGGGGGVAYEYIDTGLGSTESVTVGGAGSSASTGSTSTGSSGGTSSFGSHCSATGGGGGAGSSGSFVGGAGGVGSNGDLNLTGQDGGEGISYNGRTTDFEIVTPAGGSSALGFGMGAPGAPVTGASGTANGVNANGYGGGGSGAYNGGDPGDGTAGVVIVKSFS